MNIKALFCQDRSKHVSQTLLYKNREWIVVSGLHGTPKLVFELNTDQALLYQQNVFEAMLVNTKKNWRAFKK
jgi:hypothetical protein